MSQKGSQNSEQDFINYLKVSYGYSSIRLFKKTDHSLIYLAKNGRRQFIVKKYIYGDICNEFELHEKLQDINSLIIKEVIPTYIAGNNGKKYVIYRYINGNTFGEFNKDFGIRFGVLNEQIIETLVKFVVELEGIDETKLGVEIKKYGKYLLEAEVTKYDRQLEGVLDKELLVPAIRYLSRNKRLIYSNRVLSHIDMYPNNFIARSNNKRKIKIIDWEMVSYVAAGYNFAFLFLLMWKEEYWKYKLFGLFYNHYKSTLSKVEWVKFSKTFKLLIILISLRFISQLSRMDVSHSVDYNNAMNSFKHDLSIAINGTILKPKYIKFIINKDDILKILSRFGIFSMDDYKIYYTGHGNSVVRVKNSGKYYILRIYSTSRKLHLVNREVKMFEMLTSAGIKTYSVYTSPAGKKVINLELYGLKRNVVLLSYMQGSRISKRWANQKSARLLGTLLKKIHDVGIIHGDFSKENVLFTKSEPVSVIDFEWGRITDSKRLKLNDLTRAITLWIVDSRFKQLSDDDFIRCFLEGYYNFSPKSSVLISIYKKIAESINDEMIKVTRDKNLDNHRRFLNAYNTVANMIVKLDLK